MCVCVCTHACEKVVGCVRECVCARAAFVNQPVRAAGREGVVQGRTDVARGFGKESPCVILVMGVCVRGEGVGHEGCGAGGCACLRGWGQ